MSAADEQGSAQSPAEIYERYMVPAIFAPWAEVLLNLTEMQPGHRMLDVACGTGVVARNAVQRVESTGQVVGLDFNSGMLEIARRVEPTVEWREGNVMELPFPDQVFNVVTCQQGLQFFPDRVRAISEMHRVLVPGGVLAAAVWCSVEHCPGHAAFLQAVKRHVGAPAITPVETIFSFGSEEKLRHLEEKLRHLVEHAKFHQVSIYQETRTVRFPSLEEFVSALVGGSNLARSGVKIEGEVLAALKSDVSAALQPYVDSHGLAFPTEALLAVARK